MTLAVSVKGTNSKGTGASFNARVFRYDMAGNTWSQFGQGIGREILDRSQFSVTGGLTISGDGTTLAGRAARLERYQGREHAAPNSPGHAKVYHLS